MPNQRSIRDFFATRPTNPSTPTDAVHPNSQNNRSAVLDVDDRSTTISNPPPPINAAVGQQLPDAIYKQRVIEMYQLRFQLDQLNTIIEADRSNGIFGVNYLNQYSWLFYQIEKRRAECLYCSWNCPQDRTENRVNGVFKTQNWNSQSTIYAEHVNSNKHTRSMAAYNAANTSMPTANTNPTSRNLIQNSLANAERVSRTQQDLNAEMLLRIHSIFILCMRQGLALRGEDESVSAILEPGTAEDDFKGRLNEKFFVFF